MSTSGSEGGEEGGEFFGGEGQESSSLTVGGGQKGGQQGQPQRRGTGERKPLLPEAQRRRSKLLLSLQSDIGKGFVFAVRLSRWYLLYCALMAMLTLALVVYMIVDVHVVSGQTQYRCKGRVGRGGGRRKLLSAHQQGVFFYRY